MNKNIIIGSTVLTAIAVAAGITCYIGKTNIEKRSMAMQETIDKIKAELPNTIKVENQIEKGLFSSKGVYKLTHVSSGKSDTFIVNYNLDHGISSWFGGNILVDAETSLEGNFAKDVQLKTPNGKLSHINGVIKEDGSLEMNQNSYETSISLDKKSTAVIKINPSTSSFTYNKATGDIKSLFKYPQIVIENSNKKKLMLNNLEGTYDFNLKNTELGKINIKLSSIADSTKMFNANGLELIMAVESKNKRYDIKFATKVKSLTAMTQKDAEIEFAYSVLGLDSKFFDIYKKAYKTYSEQMKFTPVDEKEMQDAMMATAQSGFVFSIDKIKYKNASNLIDLTGKYEISPSSSPKDFSFEDKTKFGLKLIAEGELAALASMSFGPMVGLTNEAKEGEAPVNPPTKFNLSFSYENNILKINEKDADPMVSLQIRKALRDTDQKLGIIRDLPPLETSSNESKLEEKK